MNRLPRDRARLLKRRLREAVELQPEIAALRQLLLGLGGVELVAPAAFDSALCLLLGRGSAMAGQVTRKRMFGGACHRNVSRLWLSNSAPWSGPERATRSVPMDCGDSILGEFRAEA